MGAYKQREPYGTYLTSLILRVLLGSEKPLSVSDLIGRITIEAKIDLVTDAQHKSFKIRVRRHLNTMAESRIIDRIKTKAPNKPFFYNYQLSKNVRPDKSGSDSGAFQH